MPNYIDRDTERILKALAPLTELGYHILIVSEQDGRIVLTPAFRGNDLRRSFDALHIGTCPSP